jgi:hypothetical protein
MRPIEVGDGDAVDDSTPTECGRRASIQRMGLALRLVIDASRRLVSRQAALLPRLTEVDPAAWRASGRPRGLTAVEIRCVVGTVSYPYGSRRRDFLPVRGREPADWQSRWNRLIAAVRQRTPLPPVDLVRTADGYWVADGHNRLALAKALGQLWIDADVIEIGDLRRSGGQAGRRSPQSLGFPMVPMTPGTAGASGAPSVLRQQPRAVQSRRRISA